METLNGFRLDDVHRAIERVGPSWRDLRRARILITGGTGFLGQWMMAVLLEANRSLELGLEVIVLSRSTTGFRARCPQLATDAAVSLLEGDVRHFEFPKGRVTHVIHAAADTSVAADRSPLTLLDSIVDGTRRVLSFAQSTGTPKILLTSSGAVYGPQPADLEHIPEDFPGGAPTSDRRSTYAQAKRLAEQLMTVFCAEFGLQTRIARCFSFVGPAMPVDGHFAIGNFIRDAVAGGPIVLTGDGSPVRSYLYAADAAAWLIRILVDGQPGAVYNVGGDHACRLGDIARRVAAVLGGHVEIRGRAGDGFRSRYVPNVQRARNSLGLDVWTQLDEAIEATGAWLASQPPGCRSAGAGARDAQQKGTGSGKQTRTFVVDIDGVIASLTPGNDYSRAAPLAHTLAAINALYVQGHRIVLCSARGSATGIDWAEVTRKQLRTWNVRHHELRFGKPAGDFYVDDRLLSIGELQKIAFADRPIELHEGTGP